MYADYLKERTNDEILESNEGFATYRYLNEGKSVYIIDIYVRPEFRQTGAASALANVICQIADKKGCTEVLGTVIPSAKGSTASLKVLLAYGMELQHSSNDLIVFRKAIG